MVPVDVRCTCQMLMNDHTVGNDSPGSDRTKRLPSSVLTPGLVGARGNGHFCMYACTW